MARSKAPASTLKRKASLTRRRDSHSSTADNTQPKSSNSGSTSWQETLKEICNGFGKGTQGKEYDGPLSSFFRAGKLIPRLINPFIELNAVFIRGLVAGRLLSATYLDQETEELDDDSENYDDEDDDDNEEVSEAKRSKEIYLEAFDKILVLEPTVINFLKKLCRAMNDEQYYKSDLRHFFSKGSVSARTGDTRKVKDHMMDMIQNLWDTGALNYIVHEIVYPLPASKSNRGFNNVITGALLCPARLLHRYDDAYRLLMRDGTVEVTAHDYPAFMYDDSRCFLNNSTGFPEEFEEENSEDEDNEQIFSRIMTGLCRGPLLLSVCQDIFFGSGIHRSEKHATKPPIASTFQIMSITPEMIAYSATQARFALGSVSQWNMPEGLFSYADFYYNVLHLFKSEEWATETLKYWNGMFYSADGTIRLKKKSAPPPPKVSSDISRLKRAEKHRAKEAKRKQEEERERRKRERRERREQEAREREERAEPESEEDQLDPDEYEGPARSKRRQTGSQEEEDEGNGE
ncbi:hypothetical protein H0H92_002889 [Tricholoma furcatifolium]|nr:hypothetical protein H0H92_002889 [Tricholoma furcatifolium]